MKMYEVTPIDQIDFGATGNDEIIQNVRFIIASPENGCILDRSFGWNQESIDAPIEFTKAQLISEIVSKIESQEPRVKVKEVTFEENHLNGTLIPKLKVVIISDTI